MRKRLICTSAAAAVVIGTVAVPNLAYGAADPSSGSRAPTLLTQLAPTESAAVFDVISEGMSPAEGRALARRAGVGLALRSDGSMSFVNQRAFSIAPTRKASARVRRAMAGRADANERVTAAAMRTIDFGALRHKRVLPKRAALRQAAKLLPALEGYGVRDEVGNTVMEVLGRKGRSRARFNLDTTISRHFELAGKPVVGPGAKSRIAFDGSGRVVSLNQAIRRVREAARIPIFSAAQASLICDRLYGQQGGQLPALVYYAPPLTAAGASGQGSVRQLLPHYACSQAGAQSDGSSPVTGKLVPASLQLAPQLRLTASGDGKSISAGVQIAGGLAPYSIKWSASTPGPVGQGEAIRYARDARNFAAAETVSVQVTDTNGIVSTATASLPGGAGAVSGFGFGGAGGAFAQVGIEQTVDEWQCAQDSANGFRSVMADKGQSIKFDWRGADAWEQDFKRQTLPGGDDPNWVDSVDAQWYTGHGWPGGFTFKGSHTDTSITPDDASWGDSFDLEWLQLESCQVLQDTTGTLDHLTRWAPAFNGLHLINGFHTNAYCIDGGTGRRFAEYLFPEKFLWWTTRSPLTVQQAWAAMANDLEPAGVRWRTMSPLSKSGVTNLGDYYWGQGAVGPDIPKSDQAGFVSISGLV